MVIGVRFVLGPDDRCVPVVPVLHVFGIHAQVLDGCGHDVGRTLIFHVQYLDGALVAAA